ncbi:MAG: GGDEF domain-containing protein [Steroidobacteraceae bacterium]
MAPQRRATLFAVIAESQRQAGQAAAAIVAAEAGLAALGNAGPAALRLRLEIARALAWHADHQTRRGLERLDALLALQTAGSAGATCILKDRGWLRFGEGNVEGALSDLMQAYQQLRVRGDADEQTIVAGRLAAVYVSAREYSQAIELLGETIDYFMRAGANSRLPTAYDRLGRALAAQGRYPDAIEAFEKMGHEALRLGDRAAQGYSDIRICGVQIERGLLQAAAQHCASAQRDLAQASSPDREERRILDAYLARIDLASGRAQAALQGFDRAINGDPAGVSKPLRAQFHLWRAGANAALGRYADAYADMQEHLARTQALTEIESERQVAVLRVRFATDREVRKNEVLARDNALKQERLARQQLATWLSSAVAAVAAALLLALGWNLQRTRRHRRELQQLAETDELTRLPNRRTVLSHAAAAFAAAREQRNALTVALIDIDHFKTLNDRFGHACGDRVLQQVAQSARAIMNGRGEVGRYGGEEFLVVLPGHPLEAARPLIERLREAVKLIAVPEETGDAHITLSAGIAALQLDDVTVEQMIRRADAALYTAKNAGRDRVSAILA